ncbi:MAG: FtsX-like permease family protein, partial [Planctomycetota bacterium]
NAPINIAELDGLVPLARAPFEYLIPTQLGDSYRGRSVMATVPEFFTSFEPNQGRPLAFAEGRAFVKKSESPFEIVAGADAASSLGLSIGDVIALSHGGPREESHVHTEYQYEVVGILEPTLTPHDRALFTELTSAWILHAVDDSEGLETLATEADIQERHRQITGVYARLARRPGTTGRPANFQSAFEAIRRSGQYTIAEPNAQIAALFRIVGNVNAILLALAIAVLISSGITLMLALYNTMEQRRRQIAVLRVLGCSRGRIFGLVLTESAILGTAGAIAGVLLSLFASVVVSRSLAQAVGVVVEPSLPVRETMSVVVGAIVLAALAGLIPALTAYRTPVIRNLRPIG